MSPQKQYTLHSTGQTVATRAVDTLMGQIAEQIPAAVDQIFDEVAADTAKPTGGSKSDTISYEEWEREWTRHPELLAMMSVRKMSEMVTARGL